MSGANESLGAFIQSHATALAMRLGEHIQLSALAIFLAFVFGVSLALLTYRRRALWVPVLAVTSMMQTIPGIALLVMMMALLGRIGQIPALAALSLYALLPIVQNSLVGLHALPASLAEAARGLGLTRVQQLWHVRLPLALPMIIAGLRTSAVQTVGLATLAAFVGAGGLGQFINRGLFLSDTRLILLGAIPAALLALLIHFFIGLIAVLVGPAQSRPIRRRAAFGAALIATIFIAVAVLLAMRNEPTSRVSITIGSKNFTEQLIVAEMVAQQIERHTELPVIRRFGLGGSNVMHQALTERTIDLGIEYTGTALSAILRQPPMADTGAVFAHVQAQYADKFNLVWLPPLGFNNSYQLAVREDDASLAGIATISSLENAAPSLTAAFDFEFAERDDGYAGLKRAYGLRFGKVLDMHPDLLYGALATGKVDVISAYATDGRLQQPGIRVLVDDQRFFPPYEAAIVVREATLRTHPELEPILQRLSGTLNNARMAALNAAVDSKRLSVEQAAREALKE